MAAPDYPSLADHDYYGEKSVNGDVVLEIIPPDVPTLLGKYVMLTHYFDATNLYHNMLTRSCSITSILHLSTRHPSRSGSPTKKQARTVETATYHSKFIVAHTCVDQITDLHSTLHNLGVCPFIPKFMFLVIRILSFIVL